MSLLKLAELVGYELKDEKDFDEVKAKEFLDNKFVAKDLADKDPDIIAKVTGKFYGQTTANVGKVFGLKASEVADKKFEEVLEIGKQRIEAEKKALQDKIGKTDNEQLVKLQLEIENEKSLKADVEKERDELKGTFETFKTESGNTIKKVKLGVKLNEVRSKIPFTDEFLKNPVLQKGFDAIVNDNYITDLDEHDDIIVLEKATGKPVKHPKTTGKNANLDDVLKMVAEQNKFLKKNDAVIPVSKTWIKTGISDEGQAVDVTRVNPKALKHSEKLHNGVSE